MRKITVSLYCRTIQGLILNLHFVTTKWTINRLKSQPAQLLYHFRGFFAMGILKKNVAFRIYISKIFYICASMNCSKLLLQNSLLCEKINNAVNFIILTADNFSVFLRFLKLSIREGNYPSLIAPHLLPWLLCNPLRALLTSPSRSWEPCMLISLLSEAYFPSLFSSFPARFAIARAPAPCPN